MTQKQPPLRKFKNGWNKQPLAIAKWKQRALNMGRGDEDMEQAENSSKGESWLHEQSFITDSEYAEVLSIKLHDDKYLKELISKTLFSRRKQSKKQFLYEPSTPRFDRRPERKKKEADKHKLSLPYIPKSRSLMRQSHD